MEMLLQGALIGLSVAGPQRSGHGGLRSDGRGRGPLAVTSVSARLNPPYVPPPASQELPSPAERPTDESQALVHCRGCWADHPLSTVQTLSAHRSSAGVVTYFRCPTGHADFFTTRRWS